MCRRLCAVLLGAALACAGTVQAQGAGNDNDDIRYVEGLKALGFPDYAQMVLSRVGDRPETKVLKIELLLAKGQFDDVKAIIDREPSQDSEAVWAMRVSLADYYYAWGKYAEAKAIYESFFKKYPNGPTASINKFYRDSAYKYARMLDGMGQPQAAVGAYNQALKAKMESEEERQIECDLAELMLKMGVDDPAQRKTYFEEVDKICQKVLWIQDIWFGKAIVMLAHMKMVNGDFTGAMDLVDHYKEQLLTIDQWLKEQTDESGKDMMNISPMAQCRYLVGVIEQQEAEKLLKANGDKEKIKYLLVGGKSEKGTKKPGALQHFLTVFVKYPMTSWAPDAGTRLRQVEEMLKKINVTAEYTVTKEQWAKVEEAQYQEAWSLLNQNKFEESEAQLMKILSLFPEGERTMQVLADLGKCYIEQGKDLQAEMLARYLGERLGQQDASQSRAGDIELGMAQMYAERNQKAQEQAMYQLFFRYFLKHSRAPGFLYRFGDQCYTQQKDYNGALGYFRQIVDNHTNSPYYYEALSKMASCYQDKGERTNEIRTLTTIIDVSRPVAERGAFLISGLYRRGTAYRELARQDKAALLPAARDFAELVKLLLADPDRYQRSTEEKERNQKLLESGIYYKATCFANMVPPAGKPAAAYKDMAVKAYEDLLKRFPKSELAPRALSQIGTIYTVLQKPNEAEQAFIRLQKEYPDSDEAKNAMFLRGKNLLDLGLYQQAVKVFSDMFSGTSGKYSDNQIFTAGNELLKYKQYDIAITAFTRVENSKEKGIREATLNGKGAALMEMNRMDEAVKVYETLLAEFKSTGYTVDACFNLSKAYSVLGAKEADQDNRKAIFDKAINAMKRSRKFVKDKGVQARSDLEIARIYMRMAKAATDFGPKPQVAECKGDAVATYQIIMMTANPQDAGVRPYLEEAYYECLPLLVEMERWSDVAEDGAGYLNVFSGGKYAPEVGAWVNRAKGRLAAGGGAASPAPAP